MKKKFIILLAACTGLFMVSLLSCAKKSQIKIDGSSTVYPITEAVAEEYRKVDSSVHVTVGVSGTGGGFKKFCVGETDISDASRPIKPTEVEKCEKNNIDYKEFSVAYDGIAVVINKDNDFVKKLTVAQLKKIFQSENPAKTWKEVDDSFPDAKINVFSMGQDSGTHDYFIEEIIGKHGDIRSDASFTADPNVQITGISGDKNAIGFFGLAYYEENKDKLNLLAIVNPKTKKAVIPTLETVGSHDYAPLSRPIFIYVSKKSASRPEVRKFVNFYLDNAGRLSKDVGYIPLSDQTYAQAKETFKNFQ